MRYVFLAAVTATIILYSIAQAATTKTITIKNPTPEPVVEEPEPEPDPVPERTFVDEVVDKVYILESSAGKNDACYNVGKFNGYGYAPGTCYNSHEEVEAIVKDWFERKLEKMSLAQALCYYNSGTASNDCHYYAKFKNLR